MRYIVLTITLIALSICTVSITTPQASTIYSNKEAQKLVKKGQISEAIKYIVNCGGSFKEAGVTNTQLLTEISRLETKLAEDQSSVAKLTAKLPAQVVKKPELAKKQKEFWTKDFISMRLRMIRDSEYIAKLWKICANNIPVKAQKASPKK